MRSFNFARLSDPRLDQLIDAAKTEIDPKKREPLLHDALQLARDKYYFVPLHHQRQPWCNEEERQHAVPCQLRLRVRLRVAVCASTDALAGGPRSVARRNADVEARRFNATSQSAA